MKNIFQSILCRSLLCAMLLGIASCASDIDPVYIEPTDDSTLGGGSHDITLNPDTPDALVLTLYWSGDGQISLSDPQLQAPVNYAEQIIELASDAEFANKFEITLDKEARSYQFLNDDLNALLGRLGYEADQMAPLYIRIRSVLGANIDPTYSNVLEVNVQIYRISLVLGTVLDSNWGETSMRLASPEENGIYTGFMGVAGWENWWFREANNIVWGNLGEDGKTFYASSDDSHWNFWFPEPAGCYYTTLNTVEGWWSGLHIDNLTVAGDLAGEMEFNRKTLQWTLPVNLPAATTVSITISGQGSLYNRGTTDMGPAIAQSVAFGGASDGLQFGETGSTISVEVPAGENTLILDLSDPQRWTLTAGEAAEEPEVATLLYFSGLVTWGSVPDEYLTLYDESSLSYGGAHWIDSEWGYRVYPAQEWDPAYHAGAGSTGLSGTLMLAESDANIPAPEAGLYVMDFSMKNLTYTLTAVESVTFTGLNDDWSEHEMVQSAENPEVFVGEFVKEKETPWGVKVLINHDWGLFFGGGSGTLLLGHSDAMTGFDGDNDLEIGRTYLLTVDLGKQTYTYTLK